MEDTVVMNAQFFEKRVADIKASIRSLKDTLPTLKTSEERLTCKDSIALSEGVLIVNQFMLQEMKRKEGRDLL